MAEHTDGSFYVTGGTLRHDAACYVERQADKDLLDGLLKGEFCYVLTSRQMGKSSLMVRTANKLREEQVHVAVLDLTAVGQNLTPEQWYLGLVGRLGRQCALEDEVEKFWFAHSAYSPLERFFRALREVVLVELKVSEGPHPASGHSLPSDSPRSRAVATGGRGQGEGRLVIFVDEVDVVRSLTFSTDEFLAGIRECYNRRSEDTAFKRLAFCLLGVASPSELIQNSKLTPFNIGRRIELKDFTPEEAAPLAKGLERQSVGASERQSAATSQLSRSTLHARRLLDRILHWTGGHPYLTQRLCRALAEGIGFLSEGGVPRGPDREIVAETSGTRQGRAEFVPPNESVDALCGEMFFSHRAREQDDNLLFVRDRLLRTEGDLAALLQLYGQIHRGKPVADGENNPLVTNLHLSGIVRAVDGWLRVRNCIYARVFDRSWIQASMPDAEVQRQKAAYRRGLVRAGGVAAVIIAVMVVLALSARRSELIARNHLYVADMNVVQHAYDEGNVESARILLAGHFPKTGQTDLRGFEWRYFWNLCRGEQLQTLPEQTGPNWAVAIAPDGNILASSSVPGAVKLWTLATRRLLEELPTTNVISISFSADSQILALGGVDEVQIWDVAQHKRISSVWETGGRFQVSFSPKENLVAVGRGSNQYGVEEGTVELWNLTTGSKTKLAQSGGRAVFSADGRKLATASRQDSIKLWDSATGQQIGVLTNCGPVLSLAFSPEGKFLATSRWDRYFQLWDLAGQRSIERIEVMGWVWSVAFYSENVLAAGCGDHTIHLWDVAARKEIHRLRGHRSDVLSLAFSPDHKLLVSGSRDKTVRLWDPQPNEQKEMIPNVASVPAFSPDSKTLLAATSDKRVILWDGGTCQPIASFADEVCGVGFFPDGKTFLTLSTNHSLHRWDVHTQVLQATIPLAGHEDAGRWQRLSPDGRLFAASKGSPGKVKLWNTRTGQALEPLVGHTGTITDLAFSPDSHSLATSSLDKTTKLWNLATFRETATLSNQKEEVIAVAFSPSGRTLATGSSDDTIRVWEAPSGKELFSLTGQKGTIRALAFSPDGQTLASAGGDRTIKLWDLATGRELITVRSERAEILRFSPDGRTLVGWADWTDRSLHFWRAPDLADLKPESDLPREPATTRIKN